MSFINTMLGKEYSFFLGNEVFGESYYSYQIYSPGLSSDCTPLVSLTKVNEKVVPVMGWDYDAKDENGNPVPILLPNGKDSDILQYLMGPKKIGKKMNQSYLKTLLRKEGIEITAKNNKFPDVKMEIDDSSNTIQKTIIISLRDAIRWKSYKFKAGNKIDLLYSPTEFIVFEFKETENQELYLSPVAVYKNYDVEMKNPLKVDLTKLKYPTGKWTKDKFSDMNISFKFYEWESFGRKELTPRLVKKF